LKKNDFNAKLCDAHFQVIHERKRQVEEDGDWITVNPRTRKDSKNEEKDNNKDGRDGNQRDSQRERQYSQGERGIVLNCSFGKINCYY
jgi:hypothetical protein